MIHAPTLDSMKHEIRGQICRHCPWRQPVDRRVDTEDHRPCEHDCPIFVHLPELMQLMRLADPMLASRRRVLSYYLDRLERTEAPQRVHLQILQQHREALGQIVHRFAAEW